MGAECWQSSTAAKPMAMTANPTAAMTRADFDAVVEPLAARIASLEDSAGRGAEPEVVTASEFRLFKWLGTFALATVVGGFALLYEQVSDVRIGMERLHGELLGEMAGFREDIHAEMTGVRQEISAVRERVVRVETLLVGRESPPTDAGSAERR